MQNQIVVLRAERKLIVLNPTATPYVALDLDAILSALADAGMRVVPVIPATVPVPAKPAPAPAPVQMPLAPHISNNPVVRLLNRYGLASDSELSKQLSVSQSTVSNWHAGKSMPYSRNAEEIAALLEEPVSAVLADFSALRAAYLRKNGGE